MVEELTSQDQSLEGVIDMVKKLIAQLDVKIKCAIKKLPSLNDQAGQF